MKALAATATDILKTPTFIKIAAITLLSLSLFLLANHYSATYPSLTFFSSSTTTTTSTPSPSLASSSLELPPLTPPAAPSPPPPSPPPPPEVERMGIVDENGAMSEEFEIGEFDPSLVEDLRNVSGGEERLDDGGGGGARVKVEFKVCDESMTDYIPCLDNVEEIEKLNSRERGEKYERHCPGQGKGLNCVVPRPKGYQIRIHWPQSRDEVWFSNVPHTRLVDDKGGQNWIRVKKDKFIFPGGGTQFIHGADQYLNQISQMVPDIAFGYKTRVSLDIGCGVASFGAFLMQRNVTTMSIAPKDVHENQIQFALERGVPAMVAVFATHRLLYPSQAFDLIHCSRCRINWTRDDGILLLEADRLLRAGGYFVWAAQPVYKHEEALQEQWKEMENLTTRLCWELVKKEGYIAIWQKPLNNSCYLSRDAGVQPPLCDSNDDPDDVCVAATKSPVIFIGTGEHMDEFEVFDVKPFVSRLLGMGDWSGFMDKIHEVVPMDQQPELLQKLSEGNFTLRIMYEQFQNILKMGPISQVFSMLPGFSAELMPKGREKESQAKIKRYMTMMDSMTNEELDSSNPKLINESRIMRIAQGSGRQIKEVMEMFEEYKRLAKIWSKMKGLKIPKKGEMSALSRNMNAQHMSKVLPPQMLKQIGGMGGLQSLMKQMGSGKDMMGIFGGGEK